MVLVEVWVTLFVMSCHVVMSVCHFCHMLSDQNVTNCDKLWQIVIIWLLHQNKRFSTHFFFRNLRLAILEVAPTLFLMSCHVIMSLCHFCHMLSRFCHNFGHFWADSTWQKWHTDMMTWHDIKNNVGVTSINARRRFLKKNGLKIFYFGGVTLIWNSCVEKSTQRR